MIEAPNAPNMNDRFLRVTHANKKYPHTFPKKNTLYRWSSGNKYPGLFKKVGRILFIDTLKWYQLIEESDIG